MDKWEKFELDCVDYLNDKFGEYAHFYHQGGSDSTVADILVVTKSKNKFYIEAKLAPSQCGQFVLLPDIANNKFVYSHLNASEPNNYTRKIEEHMNKYFDKFREAGTAGKEIVFENANDIFAGWIINNYKSKGVEYVISNNFTLISLDDFSRYFDISAKYRIKRSGSSAAGITLSKIFSTYLLDNANPYKITEINTIGAKLFVKSSLELHNKRFIYGQNEFMFSKRDNKYELRKLSNTYNANVIFSIHIKSSVVGLDKESFKQALK